MTGRTFPTFPVALILLLSCFTVLAARADSTANYLHAKRAQRQPMLPQAMLATVQQNPANYAGQVLEISGTITGVVTAETSKTVLLTVGDLPVCATLSTHIHDTSCVDTGHTIRALIAVQDGRKPATMGNLVLIAVASEYDVAQTERAESAGWARRGSLTSRSVSYDFTRSNVEPIAGASPSGAAAPHYQDDGVGAPIAALSPHARAVYGPYRTAIRKANANLTDTEIDKIATSVLYFSDQYQVDPRLIMAMIIAESGFDPNSTSRTGAMGLCQLMPGTAAGLGVTDAYDPVQNIAASVHILRGHLDKYGGAPANAGVIPVEQIRLIMAAYNAGSGAVRKYHGVPPFRETQRYVSRVESLYRQMCGRGN